MIKKGSIRAVFLGRIFNGEVDRGVPSCCAQSDERVTMMPGSQHHLDGVSHIHIELHINFTRMEGLSADPPYPLARTSPLG